MLTVMTPEQVWHIIDSEFTQNTETEFVPLSEAVGRILGEDVLAKEYVPDFNRSTVDGYAVKASDTFGCSDSMPALLMQNSQVLMGEAANIPVEEGYCAAVPTGGEVPAGADAVVMIEYTEEYGDGTIGILKPASPGLNYVYRGDDVKPGDLVLKKGRVIKVQDIGVLAAMGIISVPVMKKLRVGIISTGDELVDAGSVPGPGQVRDVNSTMLEALMKQAGAEVQVYGIIRDEEEKLTFAVEHALKECNVVLISGGSSVGTKDATSRVIANTGQLLFHGIAMKPGKPTIFGKKENRAVIGLPGHPVAAMFISSLFVKPLLAKMTGAYVEQYALDARLTENVGANHGRAQYMGVCLYVENDVLWAKPVHGKSGLISSLAGTTGYFGIDRDCEGLPADSIVKVSTF